MGGRTIEPGIQKFCLWKKYQSPRTRPGQSIDCRRQLLPKTPGPAERRRALKYQPQLWTVDAKLGLVNQPVVNRVQRQLQPVRNAQLVENIVQVILHGLLGDKQLFANFLVPEPLRHELHDFFLAI
jgi:hypothetical protein